MRAVRWLSCGESCGRAWWQCARTAVMGSPGGGAAGGLSGRPSSDESPRQPGGNARAASRRAGRPCRGRAVQSPSSGGQPKRQGVCGVAESRATLRRAGCAVGRPVSHPRSQAARRVQLRGEPSRAPAGELSSRRRPVSRRKRQGGCGAAGSRTVPQHAGCPVGRRSVSRCAAEVRCPPHCRILGSQAAVRHGGCPVAIVRAVAVPPGLRARCAARPWEAR